MKNQSFLRFLETRAALFLVSTALLAFLFSSPVFYNSVRMSTDRNVACSSRNIPEHKSIAAVEPVHVFPAATHDNFSVEFPVTACNLVTIDLLDSLGKLG